MIHSRVCYQIESIKLNVIQIKMKTGYGFAKLYFLFLHNHVHEITHICRNPDAIFFKQFHGNINHINCQHIVC